MKTEILPAITVEPEFLAELESVLREGETVAGFIEDAVLRELVRRMTKAAFHERGDAALQDFRATGLCHSVDEVLDELRRMTAKRRAEPGASTQAARHSSDD